MAIENAYLRYFIVAANRRSFRDAASALNIRQSSVSRAIRRLEDELGVSLFVRHRTGARLTAAGERFLSDVLPAYEQLEIAQRTAAATGRAETGVVHVGVLTSLTGGFLRALLHGYTNGSIPYYGTYPGQYDPRPLLLCPHESCDSTIAQIAEEVFSLTKINWNSTQMNQRLPIPIRAARKVGEVLKYMDEGQTVSTDYRRYI